MKKFVFQGPSVEGASRCGSRFSQTNPPSGNSHKLGTKYKKLWGGTREHQSRPTLNGVCIWKKEAANSCFLWLLAWRLPQPQLSGGSRHLEGLRACWLEEPESRIWAAQKPWKRKKPEKPKFCGYLNLLETPAQGGGCNWWVSLPDQMHF